MATENMAKISRLVFTASIIPRPASRVPVESPRAGSPPILWYVLTQVWKAKPYPDTNLMGSAGPLESHDVVAAIYVDDFAGDAAAGVGGEEDSG
jgi:hypothetical protein